MPFFWGGGGSGGTGTNADSWLVLKAQNPCFACPNIITA